MEKQERKLKFPIGAIFLLLFAGLRLYDVIPMFGYTGGLTPVVYCIEAIAFVVLAIVLMMKKRGMPVLVIACVMIGVQLYEIISNIRFLLISATNFLLLAIWACIILLSLMDMKLKKLSALKKLISRLYMPALFSCYALSVATLIKTHNALNIPIGDYLLPALIKATIEALGLLLIGKWLINPYVSKRKQEQAMFGKEYISIGRHICLLLFTCGIWQFIWIYKATVFTNSAPDEEKRNPMSKLLLCMFIPFYMIYWTHKTAQRIDKIAEAKGIGSSLGKSCLVLAIFVSILPPILIQGKINQIAKAG